MFSKIEKEDNTSIGLHPSHGDDNDSDDDDDEECVTPMITGNVADNYEVEEGDDELGLSPRRNSLRVFTLSQRRSSSVYSKSSNFKSFCAASFDSFVVHDGNVLSEDTNVEDKQTDSAIQDENHKIKDNNENGELYVQIEAKKDGKFKGRMKQIIYEHIMNATDSKSTVECAAVMDVIDEDYKESLRYFQQHEIKNTIDDDHNIESHLRASSHILQQFMYVLEVMEIDGRSVYSDHHDDDNKTGDDIKIECFSLFFHDMECYLLSQLTKLYKTEGSRRDSMANLTNSITSDRAAEIAVWYNDFVHHISNSFPYGKTKLSNQWIDDMYLLSEYYIESYVRQNIKSQCQDWIDDIITGSQKATNGAMASTVTDDEAAAASKVIQISHWPEDITTFIKNELDIVWGNFAKKCVTDIVEACSDELSRLITSIRTFLHCDGTEKTQTSQLHSTSSTPLPLATYCCIINDSCRISRLLGTIHDQYFYNHSQSSVTSSKWHRLQKRTKQIERDFVELSFETVHCLCRSLLFLDYTQQMNSLRTVGSLEWESIEPGSSSSSASVVKKLIFSLQDNISDVEIWLSNKYYFHRLLLDCVHLTIQTYVSSFFTNTMASGIQNSENVSSQLQEDYYDLVLFFDDPMFKKHYDEAVLVSERDINTILLVILSMSRLMNLALTPYDLIDDARTLLQNIEPMNLTGEINKLALLHIAGLRDPHGLEESAMDWIQAIRQVEKDLSDRTLHRSSPPFNSKVLRKESSKLSAKASTDDSNKEFLIKLPDLRDSPFIMTKLNSTDLTRQISGQMQRHQGDQLMQAPQLIQRQSSAQQQSDGGQLQRQTSRQPNSFIQFPFLRGSIPEDGAFKATNNKNKKMNLIDDDEFLFRRDSVRTRFQYKDVKEQTSNKATIPFSWRGMLITKTEK